jgi:GDP-4-dehydro-6-deoxy-D-mannose reductase
MKVLVTGAAGFLGTWMTRLQASTGADVVATDLPRTEPRSVTAPGSPPLRPLDVRDRAAVDRLIELERPDAIYHFAGQAFVIPSWEDPTGTMTTNLMGTLNVLEAVRRIVPRARLGFAGSGTEYGDPDLVPTPETAPLKPTSPYAASKVAADMLCYQYYRSFDIPVFRYRIFGTSGPGKRGDSVNDFASQIAAAERTGGPGTIRVGNLEKSRDVTDVRDAVRAMVRVVESGEPGGAYNIGSGSPRRVCDTLDQLISLARVPIAREVDPARLRKVDEPIHLADVSRLRGLGWAPEIPFDRTLADVLEFWREPGARSGEDPPAASSSQGSAAA